GPLRPRPLDAADRLLHRADGRGARAVRRTVRGPVRARRAGELVPTLGTDAPRRVAGRLDPLVAQAGSHQGALELLLQHRQRPLVVAAQVLEGRERGQRHVQQLLLHVLRAVGDALARVLAGRADVRGDHLARFLRDLRQARPGRGLRIPVPVAVVDPAAERGDPVRGVLAVHAASLLHRGPARGCREQGYAMSTLVAQAPGPIGAPRRRRRERSMTQVQPAPSAAERAYSVLRTRILDGEAPPGTMLGESPLAAELGMIRTPVRAALSRLQDEGWIAIYPKRGALVRGLGQRAVAELAQMRVLLETAGERCAPAQLRAEVAARLEDLLAAQRRAQTERDLPALLTTL